jgi:hypothetical protein
MMKQGNHMQRSKEVDLIIFFFAKIGLAGFSSQLKWFLALLLKCIMDYTIIFLSLRRSKNIYELFSCGSDEGNMNFLGAESSKFPKQKFFLLFQIEEWAIPLHSTHQANQKIYINYLI